MKKTGLWITIILVCLLVGAAFASETTAVPSPALSVTVTQVTAQEEGKVLSSGFLLREVELESVEAEKVQEVLPPATAELFLKLQEVKMAEAPAEEAAADATVDAASDTTADAAVDGAVEAQPVQPVQPALSVIIPEEKVAKIAQELPEETVVENLVIAEFIPMECAGYEQEIGDVKATIAVPGEYTEEEPVVALVGVWNGEEMEWFVAEIAVDENGELMVSFTEEMLTMMNVNESVLLILRDNQTMPEMM